MTGPAVQSCNGIKGRSGSIGQGACACTEREEGGNVSVLYRCHRLQVMLLGWGCTAKETLLQTFPHVGNWNSLSRSETAASHLSST
jgi:hypothetical protein